MAKCQILLFANLIIRHLNLFFFSNFTFIEFISLNFIPLYPLHPALAYANLDIIHALRTRNRNGGRLELLTVHFLMPDRFFSAVIAVYPLYRRFTLKILSEILLTGCHSIIMVLFWGIFLLDPAINNSLIYVSRYSQHLSARYCDDAVRRSSALKRLEGSSNPFT